MKECEQEENNRWSENKTQWWNGWYIDRCNIIHTAYIKRVKYRKEKAAYLFTYEWAWVLSVYEDTTMENSVCECLCVYVCGKSPNATRYFTSHPVKPVEFLQQLSNPQNFPLCFSINFTILRISPFSCLLTIVQSSTLRMSPYFIPLTIIIVKSPRSLFILFLWLLSHANGLPLSYTSNNCRLLKFVLTWNKCQKVN